MTLRQVFLEACVQRGCPETLQLGDGQMGGWEGPRATGAHRQADPLPSLRGTFQEAPERETSPLVWVAHISASAFGPHSLKEIYPF